MNPAAELQNFREICREAYYLLKSGTGAKVKVYGLYHKDVGRGGSSRVACRSSAK
jgi:hypothetical protein